jgi:Fic family protein
MWAMMRADIEETFPPPSGVASDPARYLAQLDERYVQDAYHSLSIEGYQVTPELVEKIREGRWDPGADPADRDTMNALAARGYWEAFTSVKSAIADILEGKDAAAIVREAHHDWQRALFAPAVQSGLIPPAALAGYRRGPVYIRGSRHVPLPAHAVADAMAALFDLIAQESNPAVRAVLGHFLFVFIHPYSDGNGRIGRFLMNAMFASGGYPWTIVHVENRTRYMESLEEASVNGNIRPFASFVLAEMTPT